MHIHTWLEWGINIPDINFVFYTLHLISSSTSSWESNVVFLRPQGWGDILWITELAQGRTQDHTYWGHSLKDTQDTETTACFPANGWHVSSTTSFHSHLFTPGHPLLSLSYFDFVLKSQTYPVVLAFLLPLLSYGPLFCFPTPQDNIVSIWMS